MEIAIRTMLWVHVLAGTLALVVAPIAGWITYYKVRFNRPKPQRSAGAA